jgi:hypothetical protein
VNAIEPQVSDVRHDPLERIGVALDEPPALVVHQEFDCDLYALKSSLRNIICFKRQITLAVTVNR